MGIGFKLFVGGVQRDPNRYEWRRIVLAMKCVLGSPQDAIVNSVLLFRQTFFSRLSSWAPVIILCFALKCVQGSPEDAIMNSVLLFRQTFFS